MFKARFPSIAVGSSPRVWGIRNSAGIRFGRWRFIPTCVGNTWFCDRHRPAVSVHPHVCGEYPTASATRTRHSGSSPRVWGIRLQLHRPAMPRPVHPHVCGEYRLTYCWCIPHFGSSPRVWGILRRAYESDACRPVHPHVCGEYAVGDQHCRRPDRFIPTCVGNTWAGLRRSRARPVHPHVCGEYVFRGPLRATFKVGSSPRVWGILPPSLRLRLL